MPAPMVAPHKVVAVLRAPADAAPVLPPVPGLRAATLHRPTGGEPGADPEVVAVWMLWVDDPVGVTAALRPAEAYRVDERVQWRPERDGETIVTRLSFLRAANGLSRQQFGDHWRDVHAPLARRHHPNVIGYVQNVVLDALTPDAPPVDGIAELSFRDVEDMQARRYDSEKGQAVISADVRRFIDLAAGWRVLTTAQTVAVPDGNAF
jgi:uncharacterized protein (TIGR02118 family)